MITREVLASRLRDYLQRRTTLAALVDWAEKAVMDDEFDERDFDTIRDITSRLGLADVREFGLTSEDCEAYPSRLGYRAKVDVIQATLHTDRLRGPMRTNGGHDARPVPAPCISTNSSKWLQFRAVPPPRTLAASIRAR